ncbi:MAG: chemotaxis protein CheW [Acidobacteriota bacterium]
MALSTQLVAFTLDHQRFALRLSSVEQAARMAEITPLPRAPDIVLGVINLRGRIIPVFNLRKRFHLPERQIDPDDQLLIARASRRAVALAVDQVSGLVSCADERITAAEEILPRIDMVEGVVRLDDGMILVHDLDRFLSLDEEESLDECLRDEYGRQPI